MTILEAIKAKAVYPMSGDFFLSVLTDRGLTATDEYTQATGASKAFKGALADVYFAVSIAPSISEGDISISKEDADVLKRAANALYAEIGEDPKGMPIITFID